MRASQRGAGLVEVLVALGLSTLGMMGLLSLQHHSTHATYHAVWQRGAARVSQNFTSAVHSNRQALSAYVAAANAPLAGLSAKTCGAGSTCTAAQIALADVADVKRQAAANLPKGKLGVHACSSGGGGARAVCVFVAWQGVTSQECAAPTAPVNSAHCYQSGALF